MFFMLLAVAGNETTRNATSHGMRALHRQPRPVRQAARPTSTAARPAPSRRSCAGPPRCCTSAAPRSEDYEIGGRQIKEGDKVVMWYISANRDETVFDDPFRFDIERYAERAHRLRRRRRRTSASAPTWPAWSSS